MLLAVWYGKGKVLVSQSRLTVVCSPRGLSVCGDLQGIFLTQRWNPGLLHWQADSLPLSHQGGPGVGRQLKSGLHLAAPLPSRLPQHPSPPTPKSSTLSLPPGWGGRALGTSMTAASDQRTCRGRRGGGSPARVFPSQVHVSLRVPSHCLLPTAGQPTAHR